MQPVIQKLHNEVIKKDTPVTMTNSKRMFRHGTGDEGDQSSVILDSFLKNRSLKGRTLVNLMEMDVSEWDLGDDVYSSLDLGAAAAKTNLTSNFVVGVGSEGDDSADVRRGKLKRSLEGLTVNNLINNGADYANCEIRGTSTTKSSDGIHLVADGSTEEAVWIVNLDSAETYTLFARSNINRITGNMRIYDDNVVDTAFNIYNPDQVGIAKTVFTTQNTIAVQELKIALSSGCVDGEFIEFEVLGLLKGDQSDLNIEDVLDYGLNHISPTFTEKTGANPVEVFPIYVNAGTFDFSAINLTGRTWYFKDGTTSTDERPTRVLDSNQTVYLVGDFSGSPDCEINDNDTGSLYTGDLSNIPLVKKSLHLSGCSNITGNLKDLPKLSNILDLKDCVNITGDISNIPQITESLNLFGLSNITGKVTDLPPVVDILDLRDCVNITGTTAELPRVTGILSLRGTPITGTISDLPRVTDSLDIYGCTDLTGDISDMPPVTNYLKTFGITALTGVLSDLPPVTDSLDMYNCNLITGSLADLPPLTQLVRLYNCNLITGSLADLPTLQNYLDLRECPNITGSLAATQELTTILINNIGCSSAELDITIANLVTANQSNGELNMSGLNRTSASDADIATLQGRGWTITDATVV